MSDCLLASVPTSSLNAAEDAAAIADNKLPTAGGLDPSFDQSARSIGRLIERTSSQSGRYSNGLSRAPRLAT